MNDDLLMDLADCGSVAAILQTILAHHTDWPEVVPVEALARNVGIVAFDDLEVEGFVGALMTDDAKNKGIILTKAGLREERRRFTVAHELGHFLIPSHRGDRHCTAANLRERRTDTQERRQESEANRFAAELLMPTKRFARVAHELGGADLAHVIALARRFGTSIEATGNRYIATIDDACALVFSKDGVIRYARPGPRFPRLAIRRGDRLPDGCFSLREANGALRTPSLWVELGEEIWLCNEWGKTQPAVLEQTMRQSGGYRVTLLVAQIPDNDEVDEVDEEQTLKERWRVSFGR